MGSDHPLSPPPPSTPHSYPPMIIVLTIVFLVFLFVGFFSIYCCRCFMQNILCTWHVRHNPTGTPVGGAVSSAPRVGLDPLIVQSFPSFTYSTVKDYRKEKYGLECAICLLEFKGSDVLRLLPICCHVFHQECVDLWLESHDTCPVCRRNLTSPPQSPSKSLESERIEDSVSITIKDESEDEEREKGNGICCDSGKQVDIVDKFSRSHSTGHSIPRDNDNQEDRFTLRLPEDVKSRIIKGLNSSKSWSTFGEYKEKEPTNVGVSEVTGVSDRDDKV